MIPCIPFTRNLHARIERPTERPQRQSHQQSQPRWACLEGQSLPESRVMIRVSDFGSDIPGGNTRSTDARAHSQIELQMAINKCGHLLPPRGRIERKELLTAASALVHSSAGRLIPVTLAAIVLTAQAL